jgi:hypothetical protein
MWKRSDRRRHAPGQVGRRPRRRRNRTGHPLAVVRRRRGLDHGHDGSPGLLRTGPGRPGRGAVPDVEVPHDGQRRDRGRPADGPDRRPVRPGRERPADHRVRPVPAPHQPGRAAPADQRAARAHEPGRSPAGRAAPGGQLHDRRPQEAGGEAGHHRLGTGQRAGRADLAGAVRAGPVVRDALVAPAGPADPVVDRGDAGPRRAPGTRRRAQHQTVAGRRSCLSRAGSSDRSSTGTTAYW